MNRPGACSQPTNAVRLIIGGYGLLLVQSVLLILCPEAVAHLQLLLWPALVTATGATLTAITAIAGRPPIDGGRCDGR